MYILLILYCQVSLDAFSEPSLRLSSNINIQNLNAMILEIIYVKDLFITFAGKFL
jgi:hypothetical protein